MALAGNTTGRQPENGGNGNGFDDSGAMYTLTKTDIHGVCIPINTQMALRGDTSNTPRDGIGIGKPNDVGFTLQAAHSHALMTPELQVRRLTPKECERLQGFPDLYTLTPFRGKSAADGNRYKALGNSMAVPVMRYIGEQIDKALLYQNSIDDLL